LAGFWGRRKDPGGCGLLVSGVVGFGLGGGFYIIRVRMVFFRVLELAGASEAIREGGEPMNWEGLAFRGGCVVCVGGILVLGLGGQGGNS